jgi:hypothetical protein
MTAGSGDPGETPQNEGQQPPWGGYEPPPIEQTPAYGGYPPPLPPPPPGYAGFPPAGGYDPQLNPPYGAPQYREPYPPPPGGYAPPPEYGAPYPTGYGYPVAAGGTNSLAIFSLVASVVGLLCGVGSIIGIGLGAIAINQIKKTRQGGYGLAVAGIVVGVASLVISIVWMTYAWN